MNPNSPFYVVENLIEPLQSELIIDNLNFLHPDTDVDGIPQRTIRGHDDADAMIYEKLVEHIPDIEKHYKVDHKGTEAMTYEWYTEGAQGYIPHCENGVYEDKWIKSRNRDFTGVIFLSEYNDKPPFDSDFEVFGGKLEMTFWHFGFNPQIGTMIIFPSCPNFVNATAPIKAGDLYQVRFHITTKQPYEYNANNFSGTYEEWFKDFS